MENKEIWHDEELAEFYKDMCIIHDLLEHRGDSDSTFIKLALTNIDAVKFWLSKADEDTLFVTLDKTPPEDNGGGEILN